MIYQKTHMWYVCLASVLFLLSSCSYFNENDSVDQTTVSGIIIHESTGDPVSGAVIRILQPTSQSKTTASDTNGVFSLDDISAESGTQLTLEISKDSFVSIYLQLTTTATGDVNAGIIQIRSTEATQSSSVGGVIYNESTNNPVEDAQVSILQPTSFRQSVQTDESGLFSFGSISTDNPVQLTLEVRKEGYNTLFFQSTLVPGTDVSTGIINVQSESPSGSGENEPGGAAVITLTNISEQSINIQETGGITTSAITMVVQDSTGQSIGAANPVTVLFELITGTGGNEMITPASVVSNEEGMVTAHLISGNTAGVVKIEARIIREDVNLTVRSKPITVAIHGGYPDLDHFSLAAETYNFEAWSVNGNRDPISVIVGDKFSNPVKPGTPVYFSTDGGIIQGSGVTSDDGEISVDLISGSPRPDDFYATIVATTKDENDNDISVDIPVLFSGPPSSSNISVSPSVFNLPVGGARSYQLTITDINDNPLPRGTTVTVELTSDVLTLSGDTDFEIPNALDPGGGVTVFSFSVRDNDEDNLVPQTYDITVRINTPFGFAAQRSFSD